MPEGLPDLSPLNDAELQVLRLFAQGHTAKSVAHSTGRSVGAVNERLREARRKTGVGSSRELARLVVSQENRDEKLGLDQGARPVPATLTRGDDRRGYRLLKGTNAMILLAISMLSASAQLPSKAAPEKDEVLSSFMPQEASPLEQYKLVRGEGRDEPWASMEERVLEERYARLLARYRISDKAGVLCGRSLCEVTLRVGGHESELSRLVEDLQGRSLYGDLEKRGLIGSMAGFGGKDGAMLHYSYWRRSDDKAAAS